MPRHKQTDWAKGATQIAAAIKNKFGIECARQHIVNWKKLHPPFPASDDAGRYLISECFAWVEKHKARPELNGDIIKLEAEAHRAKLEKAITDAATKKFELDELNGIYIRRDIAKYTNIGAIKRYHNFVRTALESDATAIRREKLQQLGVSPEHVAIFYEFDLTQARAVVDKIERECEREAKG